MDWHKGYKSSNVQLVIYPEVPRTQLWYSDILTYLSLPLPPSLSLSLRSAFLVGVIIIIIVVEWNTRSARSIDRFDYETLCPGLWDAVLHPFDLCSIIGRFDWICLVIVFGSYLSTST